MSAGAEHSLAVSAGGELFSWGCGGQGRLGHGVPKGMGWLQQQNEAQPRMVNALEGTPVASAAAGHMHSGVPLGWVPALFPLSPYPSKSHHPLYTFLPQGPMRPLKPDPAPFMGSLPRQRLHAHGTVFCLIMQYILGRHAHVPWQAQAILRSVRRPLPANQICMRSR